MRDKDIIILTSQRYDLEIGVNARNIAKVFARHNRVLYVNPPLDIRTLLVSNYDLKFRRRLKALFLKEGELVQVEPNLWIYNPNIICLSNNWLASPDTFRKLNRINNRLFSTSIKKAIRSLGFQDFILFNDSLMFLGLDQKELLQPDISIYYTKDYLVSTDYFKRHGTWAEPELMGKGDIVVANSAYLRDYGLAHNEHSYDIGQGCVLDLFDPSAVTHAPSDLAPIPGPVIGYVGNLTSGRLDINLLVSIAEKKPEWSLVLVGFEDDDFKKSKLHHLPNVHFLGPKTPEQLPPYVYYFDVCLNPQVVNGMTIGNYPLKIDEYLAMGKPVVATRTKGMALFEEHVYLGSSAEDYIHLIQKALEEDSPSKAKIRIAFARSHTWEASVQKIYDAVEKVRSSPVFPANQ